MSGICSAYSTGDTHISSSSDTSDGIPLSAQNTRFAMPLPGVTTPFT